MIGGAQHDLDGVQQVVVHRRVAQVLHHHRPGPDGADVALGSSLPWSDPEVYVERSPLFAADKIHTPLLLLHGLDDANVPSGESEQLYTALKVLGRDVELVTFPGEDHGISSTWSRRAENRTMILEWFDTHLSAPPTPRAAP